MVNSKKMTECEKTNILTLREEKFSLSEISARVEFSRPAISKFLKKYNETQSVKRKSGSGRVKKTKSSEDRLLKRICLRDRFKNSEDIRKEFVEHGGTQISARTIRRRLQDSNLSARRPSKKPLLTQKMRQNRFQWAKEHANWTVDDWRKVVFSDESKMNLFGSDGMAYVRRRTGERLSDECIRRKVRQGGSRMIWGSFTYHGVGQIGLINGTVNGFAYKTILEDHLIPSIEEFYSKENDLIFQDDSAPCHRCKLVKDYLSEIGISTLEWPGNSPDLNPIENLRHIIKVQVTKRRPKTLPELDKVIEDVWYNGISRTILQNLVDSMKDRIQAVIKQKGGITKY